MYDIREVSENIFWVGGSDRRLERFENMFPLPGGVSYNSYLILDEKTALIDTVDASIREQHMQNLARALDGRPLDYLVVNHMEPDHCANIEAILRRYPGVKLVGNQKTFRLFSQFFDIPLPAGCLTVREGDTLSLGAHTLRFFMAPMVHWPEAMCTYETAKGILFSADAFGTFGALAGGLFADEVDFESVFLDEARRYYANIVGRYGAQVQALFKKLSAVDIRMLCPLHGPVWRKDLAYLLHKYDLWSRYQPEKKGVVLCYGSMYGHTENAASVLATKLAERGIPDIAMYDVSKTHPSYIIAAVWKYSHLVLAAPTYNMHLYFPMDALLSEMAALGIRDRKAAIIANHSWAGAAAAKMQEALARLRNVELVCPPLDLLSQLHPADLDALDAIAFSLSASLAG